MIPAHLSQQDGTSPSELPLLTPEEQRKAINDEKARRAAILACLPENITISPDKADELLLKARQRKADNIKAKAYWDKVFQPRPVRTLSLEQLYKLFINRVTVLTGRPFIIDDFNREVIHKLCLYFTARTNDKLQEQSPGEKTKLHARLSDYDLDPNKGILLAGGIGCGKTTIMRAFSSNPLCTYRVISARQISWQFADHGFQVIREFTRPESIPINQYGHTETGTCFDDLGTEEERKHYGDKVNAMAEILLSRYDNLPFNQTHITTNLNADMIEQTYGPRLRSRMREMFNLIHFPAKAPDRR